MAEIPLVLDEGEIPFYLQKRPDRRPFLNCDYRLRRNSNTVIVEFETDHGWIRSMITPADGKVYMYASLGPFLNSFWQEYSIHGIHFMTASERACVPRLLRCIRDRVVILPEDFGSLSVQTVQLNAEFSPLTITMIGRTGDFESNLEEFAIGSLLPVRAAYEITQDLIKVIRGNVDNRGVRATIDQWLDKHGPHLEDLSDMLEKLNDSLGSYRPA